MRSIKIGLLVLFVIFGAVVMVVDDDIVRQVGAYAAGPPLGYTGAPGESTCIECHLNGPVAGEFTIIAPPTYTPGATYQIVVRHVNQSVSRRRWGFELTSLSGNVRAGTLVSLSSTTQVLEKFNRQYIEHTALGTFPDQTGGAQWTFNWTAPPENIGTVDLWAAGNQANNDGAESGDEIYTAFVSIEAAVATPTPTNTPTATPTNTPTATPTSTPTATPTNTPTATPTPAGFENDIAPRPNGDGSVLSGDVVQSRRFVVGLDVPDTLTTEFQRADTAPLASRGDGLITATDTVQARRYGSGLDALQPVGGPTGPAAAPAGIVSLLGEIYAHFFGREIRAGSAQAFAGRPVTIAVEMTSKGDETAASFTLEFDTSRLANPQVELSAMAPHGPTLTVNDADAMNGRLGILVDSAFPFSGSHEPIQIISVTFDVIADAPDGVAVLSFSDSLAARSVSDGASSRLAARYASGGIFVSPGLPQL